MGYAKYQRAARGIYKLSCTCVREHWDCKPHLRREMANLCTTLWWVPQVSKVNHHNCCAFEWQLLCSHFHREKSMTTTCMHQIPRGTFILSQIGLQLSMKENIMQWIIAFDCLYIVLKRVKTLMGLIMVVWTSISIYSLNIIIDTNDF